MKHLTYTSDSHFMPDFIAKDVRAINFDRLGTKGVKAICIDLDSTLLEHGSDTVDAHTQKILKQQPLPIYVATNRFESHSVKDIARDIEATAIMTASSWTMRKPHGRFYAQLVTLTDLEPQEIAMVGDRVLQDVWGANRAGLTTIMVEKLGHLPFHEKVLSLLDRWYIYRIGSRYEN